MNSLSRFSMTLSGLCLAFFPSFSFAQASVPVNLIFPLTPRITGIGFVGDESMVWGDGMLPLWGNANQIWYVDVQGKTAFDSDWLGSLGAGLRGVFNDSTILGGYVFVDRNTSDYKNTFWFVNPGVEALGTLFDFRANGYFPTSSKKQYGSTDWADNFGVYNFVTFSGHQQFDILMTQDEEVGWGGDAEVGALIPGLRGTRVYVGGYHFSFQDTPDINGVAGRVEFPVNRYLGFTLRDSYDNVQHNTLLAGLKITLGGVNAHPQNPRQPIGARLLDPIERNMATLGQGVGEPIQNVLTPVANGPSPTPEPELERDNIWFFSPAGTDNFSGDLNNCTAENVCSSTNFTQDTIDGINALKASSPNINDNLSSSPSFYLAPGTYSSLNGSDPLEFTNDWIFGRSEDFLEPQQNALLIGAMSFFGDNNLLDHIVLQNSPSLSQDIGIIINPGAILTLKTTRIGINPFTDLLNSIVTDNFHIGIQMQSATVNITQNSEVYAYANDNRQVVGINSNDSLFQGGSTITVDDSIISVLSNINDTDPMTSDLVLAAGIKTNDESNTGLTGSTVTVSNASNIRVEAEGENISPVLSGQSYQVYGIVAGGNFSLTPNAPSSGAEEITINDSSIAVSNLLSSSTGMSSNKAVGVSAQSQSDNQIMIGRSAIAATTNSSSDEVNATGVEATNSSDGNNLIEAFGGTISASTSSTGTSKAIGINAFTGPIMNNSGNNTVLLSGNLVLNAQISGANVSSSSIGVNAENRSGRGFSSGSNQIIIAGSDMNIFANVIGAGGATGILESSLGSISSGNNMLNVNGTTTIEASSSFNESAIGIRQVDLAADSGNNITTLAGDTIVTAKNLSSSSLITGIDQNSGIGGDNTVELADNSLVFAEGVNGSFQLVKGINMNADTNSTNTLMMTDNSLIIASASNGSFLQVEAVRQGFQDPDSPGNNIVILSDNSEINAIAITPMGSVDVTGIHQIASSDTSTGGNNSVEVNDSGLVNLFAAAPSGTVDAIAVNQLAEGMPGGTNSVSTNSSDSRIQIAVTTMSVGTVYGIQANAVSGGSNAGVTFPVSQIITNEGAATNLISLAIEYLSWYW